MNGVGVMNPRVYSYPLHNPKPSTERGRRRHAARSEGERLRAESAWNRDRSTNMSRYQKALGNNVSKGDFK